MEESVEEIREEIFSHGEKKGLRTHNRINGELCGRIVELKPGYSKVSLKTTTEMIADDKELIHSGFLFCAASFAAVACVNDPYAFLLSSEITFLSPAKNKDMIIFEAYEKYQNGRKREIEVKGFLDEIKILKGSFTILIFEEHILTDKLPQYK